MISQAQHRQRTDAKRSHRGVTPDRTVPRTIPSGQRISALAVDGKVPELNRSPDPAALIGTLDRLMGDHGAQGLVREPSPGGADPGHRPAEPGLLDDGVPPGGRCRLLGVFAHPDDETFCAGGTFARYAEQGAEIMVVSATRGQAGQIRDAAAGTRRTIGAVREAELRLACDRLGITTVRCLDHVDGTLADAGFSALVDEVAEVIGEFGPDVVITFGPDGGYGHPDHVTISAVTTAACQRAAGPGPGPGRAVTGPAGRPPRLYYRCFPPGDLLLMERLAAWLTNQPDRFAGTPAFAHALLVLAEAASTMGHIRDHVQVRWYPPGSYVVEQGEAAAELFLILSGDAEVWQERSGGRREPPGRLGVGEFFGGRTGTAAPTWLPPPASPASSCPRHRRPVRGRGRGARLAGALPGAPANPPPAETMRAGQGVVCCDVSGQVMRKVEALSAYRSQFPLQSDMFPEFLLQEMFGREYFVAVYCRPGRSSGPGAHARASAERAVPGAWPSWRRGDLQPTEAPHHDATPSTSDTQPDTHRPREGSRHDHGPGPDPSGDACRPDGDDRGASRLSAALPGLCRHRCARRYAGQGLQPGWTPPATSISTTPAGACTPTAS